MTPWTNDNIGYAASCHRNRINICFNRKINILGLVFFSNGEGKTFFSEAETATLISKRISDQDRIIAFG